MDIFRIAKIWLPQAVIITGLSLLIYVSIQQNYRQSLNDPQIQMAEDSAAALANGAVPASLVIRGAPLIDAAASLAPWIAVYDLNGTPLESSAELDGAPPKPPLGVFEAAKNGLPLVVGHHLTADIPAGENRISWQTASGTRIALVVVWIPQQKEFVASGRTMREVELREQSVFLMAVAMWGALMTATLLLALFFAWLHGRASRT